MEKEEQVSQVSVEVPVTYEWFYELLRREKNREELQPLEAGFFQKVLFYLQEKQRFYDASVRKTDLFSIGEQEKLHIQLSNVRRILREFYDRREKKIVDIALNKSRAPMIVPNMEVLLPEEKVLFESVIGVLSRLRMELLTAVLELREPSVIQSWNGSLKSSEQQNENQLNDNSSSQLSPAQMLNTQILASKENAVHSSVLIRVRFTADSAQFIGEELETYGPYAKGEIAEFSRTIADMIIANSLGEEVLG